MIIRVKESKSYVDVSRLKAGDIFMFRYMGVSVFIVTSCNSKSVYIRNLFTGESDCIRMLDTQVYKVNLRGSYEYPW